jgi:hypothetical protein
LKATSSSCAATVRQLYPTTYSMKNMSGGEWQGAMTI